MDPFLQLLQITLITTQIYQSHAQSPNQTNSSSTSLINSSFTKNPSSSLYPSSGNSSPTLSSSVHSSFTLKPSSVNSGSTSSSSNSTLNTTFNSTLNSSSLLSSSHGVSNVRTTTVGTIENNASVQPSTTSNRPATPTTSGNGPATVSSPAKTTQSINDKDSVLSARDTTANIGPSQTLSTSSKKSTTTFVGTTSAEMRASSVFAQSTQAAPPESQSSVVTSKSSESSQPPTASQLSSVTDKSKETASHTSTVSESTNTTSVSHSGSFSRQTHYLTVNYSSSSASLQSSIDLTTVPTTTAASSTVQSLTPSPVSLNWTNWSVREEDCRKYCSEKGGTVTASRQCYSYSVTKSMLNDSVCTKHNISTKQVVKCDEPYCPVSGTEALRSSIFTVPVGISLILLTKFVGG